MDELFKPIKTTRKVQTNIDKFETLSLKDAATASGSGSTKSKTSIVDLSSEGSDRASDAFSLRPSHTSSSTSQSFDSRQSNHKRHDSTAFVQQSYLHKAPPASLPDDAREILKSQPEVGDVAAVLQYLQCGIEGKHDFNIRIPGPNASQIINVLATVTIPDLWQPLQQRRLSMQHAKLKANLLSSMTSVAGLGAILMQVKRISTSVAGRQPALLADMISVLSSILTGTQILSSFLSDTTVLPLTDAQRVVYWQEVTALLAGGKILSAISQVLATQPDLENLKGTKKWLGDGTEYSKWLGKNISAVALKATMPTPGDHRHMKMVSQVLKRALNLGYRDTLITELYTSLLLGKRALWTTMHALLQTLSTYEQKTVFDTILRDLARRFLQNGDSAVRDRESLMRETSRISGVAAMVGGLVNINPVLEEHVVTWLTNTSGEYAGLGLQVRRAVIATLATSQDKLERILENSVEAFGNKLQIQHGSILQQESIAQTILLTVGYLDRMDKASLKRISSSGTFLSMVSNRLSASVPRSRFLGMILAVAVSRLVDAPGKVMNFGVDEMDSEEAEWWSSLALIRDDVGHLQDIQQTPAEPPKKRVLQDISKSEPRKRHPISARVEGTKIIAIEELPDSDEDGPAAGKYDEEDEGEEEEDLQPYAAPDSDQGDSDEDPTLVNRNKPIAPVYIHSLIKQLNTNDDLLAMEMALKTAPSLIRRKADFGDELSSNVLQLASSLLNLNEIVSMEDTQRLRLESLIACVVAKPQIMGPWIASTYFEGDLSLSMRSSLLSALALGARELAGMVDNVDNIPAGSAMGEPSFPSKRLPPRLDHSYSSLSAPIDSISKTLSYHTLQPMALEAADKMTGPNVLKVRTFSSRMKVAAKTAARQEVRSKRVPKDLHKLLADSMYIQLCSRLNLVLSSLSSSPYLANSTLLQPSLLKLSLQTLIILLVTIGPNALQLASLTRESLLLLTTIHTLPSLAHDPIILPPILHLFLTLLDLNVEAGTTAEERLVTEFGAMIAELASWAAGLGDRVSVPEVGDDPGLGMAIPWPVLVAGIQVKWQEVGRKFQGRMLGLMASTDFDSF